MVVPVCLPCRDPHACEKSSIATETRLRDLGEGNAEGWNSNGRYRSSLGRHSGALAYASERSLD
jgi:hypothetical protein